ncbi:Clavaminate synthase-like protein [Saccharata proteae CBS 121410]|uniref:Clavaminate synthase-like protein n=1 Tax=Saccharata proteae CBS 121410 TaxID=1314787 RepID=A0A9P4LWS5_9PEZI|nr:Clavaminate synthase-like protein [Saccharata proteae CBS 121410]
MASPNSTIPIIDFTPWTSSTSTPSDRLAVAERLTDACRNVGFVYIINHGVTEDLLTEAFAWSKKLFDLPHEKKMLAPHPEGPNVHRGYSWPGLEKVSQYVHEEGKDAKEEDEVLRKVEDCKESYEIGSESCPNMPNVWLPEPVLPNFRAFMTDFYWACNSTSRLILRALALGLGLADENYLLNFHSGHNNQLRLLHYPPTEKAKLETNTVARMPAHSDWGSITMLFQDECGGLEVEDPHEQGKFLKATPVKNALIMNVGDLLMRWSNDYLKSTLHRVTAPPAQEGRDGGDANLTRARYSIPYFVSPDPEALIECLEACQNSANPVKYEPVVQEDYRRMRAKLQYPSKSASVTVS